MNKKDIRDSKGEPLNEGDLVKLKSGGANMTIHGFYFDDNDKNWKVTCVWQDQLHMKQAMHYVPTALIKLFVSS